MKKITFLLMTFICFIAANYAQVQVGSGTNELQNVPIEPYYGYTYSQSIYLASEIGTSGTITSIRWYYSGTTALPNSDTFIVYLGHTAKTEFANTADFVPLSGLTQVYAQAAFTTPPAVGWITLTLNTPFVYNGTSNLVVATDENKAGYDDITDDFYNSAFAGNRSVYYYSDGTNPDPINPDVTGGFVSKGVAAFVPNIIFGGITQACPTPSVLVASSVTTSSASIGWTETSLAANGYEYYISTSNAPPSAASAISGTSATNPLLLISGLTPNTNYFISVRRLCSTTLKSAWSSVLSFTTLCLTSGAPYLQNFESAVVPAIPNCTSILNAGTGNNWVTANVSTNGFSSNVLRYPYSGANAANAWFFTQGINLVAGTSYNISYKYGNDSTFYAEKLKVACGQAATVAGMSIQLADHPTINTSTIQNGVATFTPTTTGIYYFGFNAYSIANQNNLYVDDIKIFVTPTCPEPTALIVTNISNSGGQVDWTEPVVPAPLGYDFIVTTTNTFPAANATPTGSVAANNNSGTFSGLSPNTIYYVWVRGKCSATDKGPWSDAVSFLTNCANATTFSANFDAGTTFPACWKKLGTGGTGNITTGGVSAPNALSLYSSGVTVATQGLIVMPPVSNAGSGTHRLRFRARGSFAVGGVIQVGYLTDNFDASSFVSVQSFTTTSTTVYDSFSAELGTAPGTNRFLAFRHSGLPAETVLIDDVFWELRPTCFEPTLLTASLVTNNSATISWTEPLVPAANGYQYFLSTTNTAPSAASIATGSVGVGVSSTNLAPALPLLASTTYFVWVRSVCSASDRSPWSSSISFTTSCSPVSTFPWNENFTTFPPLCFTRSDAGTTATGPTGTGVGSWVEDGFLNITGTGAVKMNLFTNTRTAWLITPTISFPAGNYTFSFDYGVTTWNGTAVSPMGSDDSVKVLISTNNGTTWSDIAVFNASSNVSNTPQVFSYNIPLASATSNVKFALLGTEGTVDDAPDYDFFVDNMRVRLTPTCLNPTALIVSATTTTSATISWTAPTTAPANGYQYFISTTNTAPNAASVATGATAASVTSFNFTGLSPDTLQNVWVRSVCSATDTSEWSTGFAFRTLCAPVTTFTQNFDVTPISCVNIINAGAGISILGSNAVSAPNCLLINSATATSRAVVSLPPVSNAGAGTHWLKFKARSRFTVGGVIEVGYLTNTSNANSFVSVQAFTTTSATVYDNFTAFLGTAPGTNQVLAFRHTGVPANEVLIDDVSWEAIPSCSEPTGLTASNVTSVAATVSWTASASLPASGYQYFVATTNVPPTAASVATGSTAAGIVTVNLTAATPLVANTQYFVWVRSACSATTTSAWSPAVSFRTLCAVYTTLNENFATFPPVCFSTSSAGTVATGPTGAAGGLWVADGFLNVTALGAARANMYQSNNNAWLITPTMNLTSGNYVFSFKYGLTAYNATTVGIMGSDDSVKVLISTNGTTWTELTTFNAASNVTNLSNDYSYVVPPANSTANVRFALLASDGTVDDINDIEFFVDDLKVELNLSNNTFDSSSFSYYPNPVKDILNLDYNQNITHVSVFNLLGQQVLTKNVNANQSKIDMSNLNAGTYLVKVTADNQVKTIKVIKE